ncbi:hypothetical protein Z043_125564, partial [Scleropages formosus]
VLCGKMHLLVFILTTFLFCSSGISGGKVLVFPLDGSHWVNMKVLVEELHARGHNVTVIVPSNSWYINKTSPYYNSLIIPMTDGFDEFFFESLLSKLIQIQKEGASLWKIIKMELEISIRFSEFHYHMCRMIIRIFDDTNLMKSFQDSKYDLVLTDPVTGGEGHFAIAPSPLSYVPFPGAQLTDKMSFIERLRNVFTYLFAMFQ